MDVSALVATYSALGLASAGGAWTLLRNQVRLVNRVEALEKINLEFRDTLKDIVFGVDRKLDSHTEVNAETNSLVRELKVVLVGIDGRNGFRSELRQLQKDVDELREKIK